MGCVVDDLKDGTAVPSAGRPVIVDKWKTERILSCFKQQSVKRHMLTSLSTSVAQEDWKKKTVMFHRWTDDDDDETALEKKLHEIRILIFGLWRLKN